MGQRVTAVPLIHIQPRNAELAGGTVAEVQLGGGGPAASGVNVQGGCNPQVDLVGSEQISNDRSSANNRLVPQLGSRVHASGAVVPARNAVVTVEPPN
jgi:hypothetical protein